jgi:polar amino acid transport system substrate-binding protein
MKALTKFRMRMAQSLKEAAAYAISIAVLSVVAGSLSFAGSLDDIKKRGYMVVATEDDYPPFEAVVNGKPFGYDHALLAILKKQTSFDVRQEILPWQGILPGVASGKYDAAVTAAVITDERAKSLDFSMPIAESTMAYVSGPATIASRA